MVQSALFTGQWRTGYQRLLFFKEEKANDEKYHRGDDEQAMSKMVAKFPGLQLCSCDGERVARGCFIWNAVDAQRFSAMLGIHTPDWGSAVTEAYESRWSR